MLNTLLLLRYINALVSSVCLGASALDCSGGRVVAIDCIQLCWILYILVERVYNHTSLKTYVELKGYRFLGDWWMLLFMKCRITAILDLLSFAFGSSG